MKKIIALSLTVTVLAGCSNGRWVTKTGDKAPDYTYQQCKKYAMKEGDKIYDDSTGSNSSSGSTGADAALVIGAVITAIYASEKGIDKCMKENGHLWVEEDDGSWW